MPFPKQTKKVKQCLSVNHLYFKSYITDREPLVAPFWTLWAVFLKNKSDQSNLVLPRTDLVRNWSWGWCAVLQRGVVWAGVDWVCKWAVCVCVVWCCVMVWCGVCCGGNLLLRKIKLELFLVGPDGQLVAAGWLSGPPGELLKHIYVTCKYQNRVNL